MDNVRIDGGRLWSTLMEMAKIGATPKGGNNRQAGTEVDRQGRDLFRGWCESAGLAVTVDAMGNMFARRPGRRNDAPPVLVGSHLDTQPTGGRFDGVLGVLAALEMVRTLNDLGVETDIPIEIVNWTNEEGSRFPPAMMGSAVVAGVMSQDEAYAVTAVDGTGDTMGESLKRIGYIGAAPAVTRPLTAYFELHIEQGPILEAEERTIGVVTDAQGARWYEVIVTGNEGHAGATPMRLRSDALVAAARMVTEIDALGRAVGETGRATVGILEARPGSINVVPGTVRFTVDLRNPDAAILADMDAGLRAMVARVAAEQGADAILNDIWHSPPTPFDPGCIADVRAAAESAGFSHRDIVSGAGHDAVHMAKLTPSAMIFIPCEKGLSHNEAENITADHAAAGCEVLLRAALARANAAS